MIKNLYAVFFSLTVTYTLFIMLYYLIAGQWNDKSL